ncbi:MAG: alcohol dehydrogenase [Thermofilum sp. ex4484_79]|nr:MAG: alcohol dehydrogenase [Thermofilum sp. ex4484_79]
MKAMILYKQEAIEKEPLVYTDIDKPLLEKDYVLIKINYCGVCRTDLHIIEGKLPTVKLPVIVGHQVIGVIEEVGENVENVSRGVKVGVPWLYWSCGKCKYCNAGLENLCDNALFTGYSVDGGYAEYMVEHKNFVHPLPKGLDGIHAAPLLCGGAIGYRALKMTKLIETGKGRLGLFGFGSSAHMIIQVAIDYGLDVYVFTRSKIRQEHAMNLGAVWAGSPFDNPGIKLDAAIIFAPAGWVAVEALKKLDKAGRLVLAGIFMSPIERLEYELLWLEREIKSVANVTREDVREFLDIATKVKIRTTVTEYSLRDANRALYDLKHGKLKGSAVLKIA